MNYNDHWLTNPEYIKLAECLVEKTKDAKTAINIHEFCRDFKRENGLSHDLECLRARVKSFRHKIHKFPRFDTETKVKLMFGLSAPVDQGFLEKLRKEAEVEVDDSNRIIHYKKNGEGGLELNGTPVGNLIAVVSTNQFLEFLSKKVKETSGIISMTELSKEFQSAIGNSQHPTHVRKRFRLATNQIYESEGFDENMKIRMMFATSTVVADNVLKKLRENAIVKADEKNRIVEYHRNDGSLHLKKGAELRGGINRVFPLIGKRKRVYKEEDSDGSCDEEEVKTGIIEHQKDNLKVEKEEVVEEETMENNPVKKSEESKENVNFNSPKTQNKKRKISDYMIKSVKKEEMDPQIEDLLKEVRIQDPPLIPPIEKESIEKVTNETVSTKIPSSATSSAQNTGPTEISTSSEVATSPEAPPSAQNTASTAIATSSDSPEAENTEHSSLFLIGEESIEEGTNEGVPIENATSSVAPEVQNKDMSSSEVDPADTLFRSFDEADESLMDDEEDQTSLLTVLESFNALIDTLELPILAEIQTKIQGKMTFLQNNHVAQMIPNREIRFSLELCLVTLDGNAVIKKEKKSISLSDFLNNLMFAVVLLKFPSTDSFHQKLNEMIAELRVQDKNVPLSTVRFALETTLDLIMAL